MRVDQFWLVTYPTMHSIREDICSQMTPASFVLQVKGGLRDREIAGFFTSQLEAEDRADDLLRERDRRGQGWPHWHVLRPVQTKELNRTVIPVGLPPDAHVAWAADSATAERVTTAINTHSNVVALVERVLRTSLDSPLCQYQEWEELVEEAVMVHAIATGSRP